MKKFEYEIHETSDFNHRGEIINIKQELTSFGMHGWGSYFCR